MTNSITFTNPMLEQRADPWVYRHTDGYYYFSASVPAFDRIEIRRATTLESLRDAEPVTAWTKRETGPMSANIWAPEIHFIDGKWYIYYAAAHTSETNEGLFDHRMYVLENDSANPLEGTWEEKGQIRTKWESFALDATTFEHRGIRYLVWAQKDPSIDGNSNLYICEMENPWTLRGEQVMITTPEYDWEIIGFKVNEGAAVLHRNGRLFISYSASATNHHYCMGLLTADEDADLLDPASWEKSPKPVFQTCEKNGQYGPGHNSFTVSPDGKTDILIYHARNYKEIEGDPLYDPNRHARAQVIHWNEDGTPNFGIPVPDGQSVAEVK
ncbi:family 43 glycosylhydrolase [Paenibacillus polysaccharolyticus]|uniref:glycoside hydrolase family 43 protein n=1 Tax=Paenibacillus polysaccharolyticus TaxID=582692 RepID=UPI00300B8E4F